MTVSIYTPVMQKNIHYDSDYTTNMAVVEILAQGRDVSAGPLYTTVMQITVHYGSVYIRDCKANNYSL